MTTQRQQRRSLAEANTQLAHYATTLEQLATTRERNRLAQELHDTLAHTLSAVAVEHLRLFRAEPPIHRVVDPPADRCYNKLLTQADTLAACEPRC